MDSRGHVYASRKSNDDQTACVTRHFFFTRDLAKSYSSIFDQMDTAKT